MNSVLNPEAPEFYPHLTSVTQGGYRSVNKSIKSSNAFPTGPSYDMFKTVTDFNILSCQLSKNVVLQSNQIIASELPIKQLLKRDEHAYNTEKLIDVNDTLIDRININIDTASGINDKTDIFLDRHAKPKANIAPWNDGPVIAKIQVGSTVLIGAKNVPRPQLKFKDAIDNSDSLWVPKISDKPNNIKPLALNILYNDDGMAVGYEHPYKIELDLYHPPAYLLEPDAEEPAFPASLEDTRLTYIDTEAQLDALVEHLYTVNELAVDLEHHSYRTYQGITCLMQLTTNEGGDFIIDTLAIREHIHKLNIIFTDPKKTKIFHGAESDVVWLQRDFGVYLVGMFDTHQAAKVLNLSGLSLKFLLMKYCSVDADKRYQLADWRMRPLPDELIAYARMDTHYLIYIWRQMKAELLDQGAGQPHVLLSVFEQSRQICEATYNKEVTTDKSHMQLYTRWKRAFNSQQMAALKMLYKWRDTQARALDESPIYLLPNHMLLALAEALPREVQGVNAICNPMPPFIKQNVLTIHGMILSCRALPNEQLYRVPKTMVRKVVTVTQPHTYHLDNVQPEYSEEYAQQPIDLYEDLGAAPDAHLKAVLTPINAEIIYEPIVSDLNADAKQFVPPFERYKRIRSIVQMDQIKEIKEKEAKIAAISKGNELIKNEVLVKLQQAKINMEKEDEHSKVPADVVVEKDTTDALKKTQRKRKISTEKVEVKDKEEPAHDDTEHKKKEVTNSNNKKTDSNVKSFAYKNVDYKKFFNQNNKDHKQKQPKMKFKKYKN